jgi:hypothetical protein
VTSAADIDALLSASKTLAGSPVWMKDDRGTVSKLTIPVAEAGVVGSLVLEASATLNSDPQHGSCVLVFEGRPIQRLSFRPDHAHVNPLNKSIPKGLRGLRLPPGASRMYPWTLNRTWPRPASDNVPVAEPIDPEPESFHSALTIFLRLCGIEGDLPPPPWEPRLL